MKREGLSFFYSLFSSRSGAGAKGGSLSSQLSPSTEVYITESAQPHVLHEKMRAKKLTHGETVTATLSPVRLSRAYGRMALYFCPMQDIEISETVKPGDGNDIPEKVVVEGLTVPSNFESGMYSLKNVRLTSNGTIQVNVTEKTTWEALPKRRKQEEFA